MDVKQRRGGGNAAALYAETGNERGMVFNKGMTAVVLSVMGRYEQAQAVLNACLTLAPEAENPESFAIAHSLLAEIAWQLDYWEKALAHNTIQPKPCHRSSRQLQNHTSYLLEMQKQG